MDATQKQAESGYLANLIISTAKALQVHREALVDTTQAEWRRAMHRHSATGEAGTLETTLDRFLALEVGDEVPEHVSRGWSIEASPAAGLVTINVFVRRQNYRTHIHLERCYEVRRTFHCLSAVQGSTGVLARSIAKMLELAYLDLHDANELLNELRD